MGFSLLLSFLRFAYDSVAVKRIECFSPAFAGVVFDLFDPNGELQRSGTAHRRQTWTMSAQRQLESFIKIAGLITVAFESAYESSAFSIKA